MHGVADSSGRVRPRDAARSARHTSTSSSANWASSLASAIEPGLAVGVFTTHLQADYPGLPSFPQHVRMRQMVNAGYGFGGMLTFDRSTWLRRLATDGLVEVTLLDSDAVDAAECATASRTGIRASPACANVLGLGVAIRKTSIVAATLNILVLATGSRTWLA